MATTTYLSNPAIKINSIDLSDQSTSVILTINYDTLENTAFGSTARTNVAGLGNHTCTVELYMSYAATETYAVLAPLMGLQTTVVVSNTAAGLTTPSATEPRHTLALTYLTGIDVIHGTLGELSKITAVFAGGNYTVAVS